MRRGSSVSSLKPGVQWHRRRFSFIKRRVSTETARVLNLTFSHVGIIIITAGKILSPPPSGTG